MLTKVYRNGASRQAVSKAYSVVGGGAGTPAEIFRSWKPDADLLPLGFDPTRPTIISIETGLVWLHEPSERKNIRRRLGRTVAELGRGLKKRGADLSPNAFRPPSIDTWAPVTCGDFHFIETYSDVEREVCCNLFRSYSPTIIALTGRAGFSRLGRERLCSRRLSISTDHYGARYFASVSSLHIDRVGRELRRQSGISRIDLLDISPVSRMSADAPGLGIRCIDGQLLVGSAMAHALLCQALAIRARRLVRDGRRIGSTPQSVIDVNRARAISAGLRALFEVDQGPRAGGTRAGTNQGPQRQSAGDSVLDMILELLPEFQILEAEYDELAPLVLGASLRGMGRPGLWNENDLLSAELPRTTSSWDEIAALLEAWRKHEEAGGNDLLRIANEKRQQSAAGHVRGWWTRLLRDPVEEPRGHDTHRNDVQNSKKHQKPRHRGPDPNPTSLVSRLLAALQAEGSALNDRSRSEILAEYRAAGGHPDLDAALQRAEHAQAALVRSLLSPEWGSVQVPPEQISWAEPPLRISLKALQAAPLVGLTCAVEARRVSDTLGRFERLRRCAPPSISLNLIERRFLQEGKKRTVQLHFLLVQNPAESPDART